MNQAARDALRAAALAGVKQLRDGQVRDGRGGLCAMGVLEEAGLKLELARMHDTRVDGCHLCGAAKQPCGWRITSEISLLCHVNNDHGLDFIGVAEKMPVTDAL